MNNKKLLICFDGVLTERAPNSRIGPPNYEVLNKVKALLADGVDITILTYRTELEQIETWCDKYLGQMIFMTYSIDPFTTEIWSTPEQALASTSYYTKEHNKLVMDSKIANLKCKLCLNNYWLTQEYNDLTYCPACRSKVDAIISGDFIIDGAM